jgi:glyoxylase-like metal-dependent hydrolase (beta-lactamase superfamily II)
MGSIRLGDVKISRLEEISVAAMPPDEWYVEYNEEEWLTNKHLCSSADLDPETGALISCIQSWLVETEDHVIIIDTGVGNDKSRPALGPPVDHLHSSYLQLLARAKIVPENVDFVVVTHLHGDHVGWNTKLVDGHWVPTFPNATYLMPIPDLVFWDPVDDGRYQRKGEAIMQNVWADSIAPILAAGLAEKWEGQHVIDGALRLEAAPGHTPGNAVIKLRSKGETGVFIGDMLHSPVQFGVPHWNSCLCEDPVAARRSRVKTLEWACDTGALIFAGHFGDDKAAEVMRSRSAFALKAWRGFSEGDA